MIALLSSYRFVYCHEHNVFFDAATGASAEATYLCHQAVHCAWQYRYAQSLGLHV